MLVGLFKYFEQPTWGMKKVVQVKFALVCVQWVHRSCLLNGITKVLNFSHFQWFKCIDFQYYGIILWCLVLGVAPQG